MFNLIIALFIVIGLIQYRKTKSKLFLSIGIGIFISSLIYLGVLQTKTINKLKAFDAQLIKRIDVYKELTNLVKTHPPEKGQMEYISVYSSLIAANKYLAYGIKTNYYDRNGNSFQFRPSEKERHLWNYKNELYKGWYKLLLNPIITLFISVIIGLIIPLKWTKMTKQKKYIIYSTLLVILLGFLLAFGVSVMKHVKINRNGISSKGFIYKEKIVEGIGASIYYYKFVYNNRFYYVKTIDPKLNIDDSIEVKFLKNNPTENYFNDKIFYKANNSEINLE